MKEEPTASSHSPESVDEYLEALPQMTHTLLQELRTAILSSAPEAEEKISYRIPTYRYHGPLVHFAAQKSYCSLIVVGKDTLEKFKDELADFEISGTTIHFTPEKPLPAELVKAIIRARVKENDARK